MKEPSEEHQATEARREQMVKLVTKGFYNELVNYGVHPNEILKVASHLLDNLMAQGEQPKAGVPYYSELFTLGSIVDEWEQSRRLGAERVSIRPLDPGLSGKVIAWLGNPAVRESFGSPFPTDEGALRDYFADPSREYFRIDYDGEAVGIIGAENIDPKAGKLEMKKLVGESGLHGKGVGKRATFAFLYHAFMIRNVHKVYIHSRDINIRNINLNSRFGFEVEGVFFDDIEAEGKLQDVVRMALFKPVWLKIFSAR
jgi:RimJ/RimL family protein N-acetyltransferase